jgi:hypothetical protein
MSVLNHNMCLQDSPANSSSAGSSTRSDPTQFGGGDSSSSDRWAAEDSLTTVEPATPVAASQMQQWAHAPAAAPAPSTRVSSATQK